MWFIFPQLKTLGRISTVRFFGLEGRAESLAYFAQPVLGERLRHCIWLMLAVREKRQMKFWDHQTI